ncbi:hypothetical protein VCRA2110O1_130068 [Vibrio crassostreae]|nr:hypothetical protein VCRA2110O1_130068 [Vibrio crassostreae]CAK1758043.1 hypothetical protein VCRA2114E5_130085 [Vibrio crassostreae]CAK1763829.1 hypothetical protein VCRA2110O4_140069 [Vibrio crassostreae]CAK2546566.1 hypothetical protein VCRA2110O2_120068 [Vibrio crassostreae]CAK2573291.1 hypothetical protein VCRA2122O10_100099 [Vibrio crassostreae]
MRVLFYLTNLKPILATYLVTTPQAFDSKLIFEPIAYQICFFD